MTTNGANGAHNNPSHPESDPSVYSEYESRWGKTLPSDNLQWIQRARDVAEVLAKDANQRDNKNQSPRAEIALLKHSGLLKILGPKQYGGGEQSWEVGYQVIREVAKADG